MLLNCTKLFRTLAYMLCKKYTHRNLEKSVYSHCIVYDILIMRWKIAVNWQTPTVGIEPTAPPPSRSAVRPSDALRHSTISKKNGLDAAYIMRRLPRHGSLARCYHRHCPTYVCWPL